MKLNFWPFNIEARPPIIASPSAREAMGIVDPATQGYEAIRLAIADGATLIEPEPPTPTVAGRPISDMLSSVARLDHLRQFGPKTEYHLEMAKNIATNLREVESRMVADLAEDRRASSERFDVKERDIADVRQTLAFYDTAPSILTTETASEPEQVSLPKPKRVRKKPAPVVVVE